MDIELSFQESIFGAERKVVINSKFVKQKEVTISVPPGIDDGQMVRLSGMGETLEGGVPGDLYVKVHVLDALMRVNSMAPNAMMKSDK